MSAGGTESGRGGAAAAEDHPDDDGFWVFKHPTGVRDFEYAGGEKHHPTRQKIASSWRRAQRFTSVTAQMLRHVVSQLEKDTVVSFYERFITRVRRVTRCGKIVVSVDATILEVFGDDQQKFL